MLKPALRNKKVTKDLRLGMSPYFLRVGICNKPLKQAGRSL
jgi:hypothetical protein